MKVNGKSSFRVAFLVMIVLLIITHCRAVSLKSNGSKQYCSGPIHECNLELEVLLDTEINTRLLETSGQQFTTEAVDPTKVPGYCGRGKPYKGCVPQQNIDCSKAENRKKCLSPPSSPDVSLEVAQTCGIYKGSKCSW